MANNKNNNKKSRKGAEGNIYVIDYEHVVSPKNRDSYKKTHKSPNRHVLAKKQLPNKTVEISQLYTYDKTNIKHVNKLSSKKVIMLDDYSNKRKRDTVVDTRTISRSKKDGKRFTAKKSSLGTPTDRLTKKDWNKVNLK